MTPAALPPVDWLTIYDTHPDCSKLALRTFFAKNKELRNCGSLSMAQHIVKLHSALYGWTDDTRDAGLAAVGQMFS